MGAFDGYYLYCDLDGTLFDDQKRISEENRAAIRSFVEQGGRFGVATGRSPFALSSIEEGFFVNAPCILYNGAGLYDFTEKRFLAMHPIDTMRMKRVVERATAVYRQTCLQVYTIDGIFEPNPHQTDDPQTIIEQIKTLHIPMNLIQPPFIKLMISLDQTLVDSLHRILEQEGLFEGLSVFRSGDVYLDITEKGVSKGTALTDVRALCGDVKKILAIGDYNNDLEMVSLADLSGAPANAVPEVKSAADIVLNASNNESCVARFLEAALG